MLRMYRCIGYILFVFWQSMIKLSLITIFPHIWDEKIKQMITFPFISAHVVVRSRDNETNAWMTITEEKIQVKDEMSSFFTSPSIILYVSLPLVYYVHEQIDINILCWSFSPYVFVLELLAITMPCPSYVRLAKRLSIYKSNMHYIIFIVFYTNEIVYIYKCWSCTTLYSMYIKIG